MADDGTKQSTTVWPLPKFRFSVDLGGKPMSFQEVSGLDIEAQPIEYRAVDSKAFSVTKITGTDLKSTANEVAVETMVLSHDGLTIEQK